MRWPIALLFLLSLSRVRSLEGQWRHYLVSLLPSSSFPPPKGDAAVLWQSNEKRSQTHLHARARLGPMPAELLIGTEEKKRRERRPPSDPFVMREREVRMMFHLRPRPHHCSGQESRHKYGCSCLACSLRSMTGKCVVSYWCEYVLLHYKLDQ